MLVNIQLQLIFRQNFLTRVNLISLYVAIVCAAQKGRKVISFECYFTPTRIFAAPLEIDLNAFDEEEMWKIRPRRGSGVCEQSSERFKGRFLLRHAVNLTRHAVYGLFTAMNYVLKGPFIRRVFILVRTPRFLLDSFLLTILSFLFIFFSLFFCVFFEASRR